MEVDTKPKKSTKKQSKDEEEDYEQDEDLEEDLDIDEDESEAVRHLADSSSDMEMHDEEGGSDIDSDDAGVIKVKAGAGKAPPSKKGGKKKGGR